MLRHFLYTCALGACAFEQSQVGGESSNGTVTDPSGAAVPNANVSVKNAATGFSRGMATTDAGLYVFTGLPVGQHELSIDAKGFKATQRTGLRLEIGAAVTLDVRLKVGAASETVSVVADAPVVETTRASAASTVTEKAVENLPVNGRNLASARRTRARRAERHPASLRLLVGVGPGLRQVDLERGGARDRPRMVGGDDCADPIGRAVQHRDDRRSGQRRE